MSNVFNCSYLNKDVWIEPENSNIIILIIFGIIAFINFVFFIITFTTTSGIDKDSCPSFFNYNVFIRILSGMIFAVTSFFLVQNFFMDVNMSKRTPKYLSILAMINLIFSLIITVCIIIMDTKIKECKNSSRLNHDIIPTPILPSKTPSLPSFALYMGVAYIILSIFMVLVTTLYSNKSSVIIKNINVDWRDPEEYSGILYKIGQQQFSKCNEEVPSPDMLANVLNSYIKKMDSKKSSLFGLIRRKEDIPKNKVPNLVKMTHIIMEKLNKDKEREVGEE